MILVLQSPKKVNPTKVMVQDLPSPTQSVIQILQSSAISMVLDLQSPTKPVVLIMYNPTKCGALISEKSLTKLLVPLMAVSHISNLLWTIFLVLDGGGGGATDNKNY